MDVDAQGSLTASLGYQRPDQMKNTLAEILGRVILDEPVSPGEGMVKSMDDCIAENARFAQDQETYQRRYDELTAQYEAVKDRLDVIQDTIDSRTARCITLGQFIETGKVGGYAGAAGVEGKVGVENNKFILGFAEKVESGEYIQEYGMVCVKMLH